jgi:hypothetical protein
MAKALFAPLLTAAIAAVGYVLKLIVEAIVKWRTTQREQRARLVALQSLLLCSKRVFDIQNELVKRLCDEVRRAHSEVQGSYDDILTRAFQDQHLDERQKKEHALIRNYTMSCLLPLNSQMRSWLAGDTYFKVAAKTGNRTRLSRALQQLEVHLLVWQAKYDLWIPNNPERTIVYMADEATHGVGFPTGIEALVAEETGSTIDLSKLSISVSEYAHLKNRQ